MALWAGPWLTQVSKMIAGVSRAVLVVGEPDRGPYTPACVWPPNASCEDLIGPAELAMSNRRGIARRRKGAEDEDEDGAPRDDVALPLFLNGKLIGAVAIDVIAGPEAQQRAVLQLLQWAASWIEVADMAPQRTEATSALDLVALSLESGPFRAAATGLVTELATRFGCERVSLGMRRDQQLEVAALSHSADFARRTNLVRDLKAAMEEALDQQRSVVLPPPPQGKGKALIVRAHQQLARKHGADHICTLPLCVPGRIVGAITLERPAGRPFDAQTVELLELASSLLGPILDLKYKDDRWVLTKLQEALRAQFRALIGPGHSLHKIVAVGAVAVLAVLALGRAEYRIRARSTLEGVDQRQLTAAIDGFVAESNKRAGDLVKRGEVLGTLDDRDLVLEKTKWESTRDQRDKEYRGALAGHDAAQSRILGAQLAQAQAQLDLVIEQLERRKLIAPFDGIVVEGDLSDKIGSPVQRGQPLFKVAPLDNYRVILNVEEREIAQVEPGQSGRLSLPAMPGTSLPFVIAKITPVSTAKDGLNFFRVEARLEQSPGFLRPGMEGVAKIGVGSRNLFWVWTHEAMDWARLWVWSWLP